MAMRWLWWAPLVLLTAFGAVMALRYGVLALNTSETDVINRYAQIYVDSHGEGAALTDCAARPADELAGVWLVVICAPSGGMQSYGFYVNRLGGLEFLEKPDAVKIRGPRA